MDEVDLNVLSLTALRSLCVERDLKLGKRAHRKTCINALLSWKDSLGLAAVMGEMKISDEWRRPIVGDRVQIKYQGPGEEYSGTIIKIELVGRGPEITLRFDDGDVEVFTPKTFSKKSFNDGNWHYD